ncbi:chloride channel protein [Listeria ilorinensis]|uniref:chloride channel protein n=1 Tax=Listeria ilorinensis TaxID=2867439 RepID=UPI001EF5C689|nr:chloride channel protein [Listeria ilorinensis]
MRIKLQSFLAIYGIILGAAVGLIAFIFIFLMNQLIDFWWTFLPDLAGNPWYWPLIICTFGGVIVGLIQKYMGAYPHQIFQVFGEFKKTKRVGYNDMWKHFLAALVILMFGASLGPEAGLTSICAALITWVGDKMRFTYQEREDFTEFSIGVMISTIFVSPFAGLASTVENVPKDQSAFHKKKVIIYLLSIFAGSGVFLLLISLQGKEPFVGSLGKTAFSWWDLLLFVPLLFIGKYFGKLYEWMDRFFDFCLQKVKNATILLAIIGGVLLGLAGTFIPYSLFSGEHGFKELAAEYSIYTTLTLFVIAFVKLAITKICLKTGWLGGHIFPAMFSSVALGFAFASFIPVDPIFIVAVIAASASAIILDNPLVVVLLFLGFFPILLWPVLLISAYLATGKWRDVWQKIQARHTKNT